MALRAERRAHDHREGPVPGTRPRAGSGQLEDALLYALADRFAWAALPEPPSIAPGARIPPSAWRPAPWAGEERF